MISELKQQLSCWGVQLTGSVVSSPASYYLTSGISDAVAVSSIPPMASPTYTWEEGFKKRWVITHTNVGGVIEVTGQRFLPRLGDDGKSPTDDLRWSPNTDENPDQASDVSVWYHDSATWSKNLLGATLTGATEVVIGAASAAVIALLTF